MTKCLRFALASEICAVRARMNLIYSIPRCLGIWLPPRSGNSTRRSVADAAQAGAMMKHRDAWATELAKHLAVLPAPVRLVVQNPASDLALVEALTACILAEQGGATTSSAHGDPLAGGRWDAETATGAERPDPLGATTSEPTLFGQKAAGGLQGISYLLFHGIGTRSIYIKTYFVKETKRFFPRVNFSWSSSAKKQRRSSVCFPERVGTGARKRIAG